MYIWESLIRKLIKIFTLTIWLALVHCIIRIWYISVTKNKKNQLRTEKKKMSKSEEEKLIITSEVYQTEEEVQKEEMLQEESICHIFWINDIQKLIRSYLLQTKWIRTEKRMIDKYFCRLCSDLVKSPLFGTSFRIRLINDNWKIKLTRPLIFYAACKSLDCKLNDVKPLRIRLCEKKMLWNGLKCDLCEEGGILVFSCFVMDKIKNRILWGRKHYCM